MGGKRQHYLPQLLLRGFTSKTVDKKSFVWYFRKDSDPIEVSIRDIGLEKNFYGESGEGSLDETITDMESNFGKLIAKYRKEDFVREDDIDTIIELFHNLIIRTRHLRKGITEGYEKILNMAAKNFSDTDRVKSFLRKKEYRDQLRKRIGNKLKTKNYFVIEAAINKLEKTPNLLGSAGKLFADILDNISSNMKTEGEAEHNKVLNRFYNKDEKSFDIKKYEEKYNKLTWSIKKFEKKGLILGDLGLIQYIAETQGFSLPIVGKIEGKVLILPITPDKILLGASNNDFTFPSMELINEGIAQHCMDFFISSKLNEIEKQYSTLIGSRAEYVTDDILQELEGDYF